MSLAGVKIALSAAHFHSVGVAPAGPWDTVEVLDLIARRMGNAEISTRLYLSPKTVRNHVSKIFTKSYQVRIITNATTPTSVMQ